MLLSNVPTHLCPRCLVMNLALLLSDGNIEASNGRIRTSAATPTSHPKPTDIHPELRHTLNLTSTSTSLLSSPIPHISPPSSLHPNKHRQNVQLPTRLTRPNTPDPPPETKQPGAQPHRHAHLRRASASAVLPLRSGAAVPGLGPLLLSRCRRRRRDTTSASPSISSLIRDESG